MKQLKNLMTSKNRKELTNICKLIKEIDNGVCASCVKPVIQPIRAKNIYKSSPF